MCYLFKPLILFSHSCIKNFYYFKSKTVTFIVLKRVLFRLTLILLPYSNHIYKSHNRNNSHSKLFFLPQQHKKKIFLRKMTYFGHQNTVLHNKLLVLPPLFFQLDWQIIERHQVQGLINLDLNLGPPLNIFVMFEKQFKIPWVLIFLMFKRNNTTSQSCKGYITIYMKNLIQCLHQSMNSNCFKFLKN